MKILALLFLVTPLFSQQVNELHKPDGSTAVMTMDRVCVGYKADYCKESLPESAKLKTGLYVRVRLKDYSHKGESIVYPLQPVGKEVGQMAPAHFDCYPKLPFSLENKFELANWVCWGSWGKP